MSFLVQQFNNLNLPNYLPGMVLDSGAMSTTAIYNLPAANYATVSIPSANIYVAVSAGGPAVTAFLGRHGFDVSNIMSTIKKMRS